MLYYEWNFKNGESYKLRLNTQNAMDMEKRLGRSVLDILMECGEQKIPNTSDIAIILNSCLQPYNQGYNLGKTCELIDKYLETGGYMTDLLEVVTNTLQESGFIPKEQNEQATNGTEGE